MASSGRSGSVASRPPVGRRAASAPPEERPTDPCLLWVKGFGEEVLGNVLAAHWDSQLRPIVEEALGKEAADAAKPGVGQYAKAYAVKFESDEDCRTAMLALRAKPASWQNEDGKRVALRFMPDKSLPMRVRGRAIGVVWEHMQAVLESVQSFKEGGFALAGHQKKGTLYARSRAAIKMLAQIEEVGEGFGIKRLPGQEFFGISPEIWREVEAKSLARLQAQA